MMGNPMEKRYRYLIIQNIVSPYKALLFKAMSCVSDDPFKVLFIAETRSMREWSFPRNTESLGFPFEVMFDGNLEDVGTIEMLMKTLRRLNHYRPELVVIGGYNQSSYWGALAWAKKNRKKIMLINESHFLDKPRLYFKEGIKRLFVRNCDAALVDGARHKDYTMSLGLRPERIFVKGGTGPVDVSWYQREVLQIRSRKQEVCKELGLPPKNFLFVGRFAPEKNIITLLNAYKRLKEQGVSNWGLILVGNGPMRDEIVDFIDANGVMGVSLPGFMQQGELIRYYAVSDVFVLPSVSEPWGLVVSEAMASGLPVIVSKKCGCYPDIVHDGVNGFSFDPLDEEELYSLMCRVINESCKLDEMGRASLSIIKDYTPEKAARTVVDAVRFVLNDE